MKRKHSVGTEMARKLFESYGNPKKIEFSQEDLAMLLNTTIDYADKTAIAYLGAEIDKVLK